MHLNIETSIEIDTPVALVWSILLDFDAYSEWNTFMSSIQGTIAPGERLRVSIRPPGSASMSFKPKVLSVTRERELRWLGRFLLPGLFDGEHYFRLEPMGTARVRFVHGEAFSGLLIRLAKDSLLKSTREGFDEMNRALKRRAESLRVAQYSGASRNGDARGSSQRLTAD